MCAVTLHVIYYTDKFSLLRTWRKSPRWGSEISKFNRSIFFPVSIVVMAVCSSYFWSGFPFDNLCLDNSTVVDPAFTGFHRVPLYRAANVGDLLQFLYHENQTRFDESLIIGYQDGAQSRQSTRLVGLLARYVPYIINFLFLSNTIPRGCLVCNTR